MWQCRRTGAIVGKIEHTIETRCKTGEKVILACEHFRFRKENYRRCNYDGGSCDMGNSFLREVKEQ